MVSAQMLHLFIHGLSCDLLSLVAAYFDPQSTEAQITSVETNQGSVQINVTLDMGAHHLDYNNTVRVRVRDTMGAATEMDIDTVRVSRGYRDSGYSAPSQPQTVIALRNTNVKSQNNEA